MEFELRKFKRRKLMSMHKLMQDQLRDVSDWCVKENWGGGGWGSHAYMRKGFKILELILSVYLLIFFFLFFRN